MSLIHQSAVTAQYNDVKKSLSDYVLYGVLNQDEKLIAFGNIKFGYCCSNKSKFCITH